MATKQNKIKQRKPRASPAGREGEEVTPKHGKGPMTPGTVKDGQARGTENEVSKAGTSK